MADVEVPEVPLNLEAVVGFNGRAHDGLIYHPDGVHVIFPLGSTIVVKHLVDRTQRFLRGHTDTVTCVVLSPDGRWLASGQQASIGFKAPVIQWDLEAAMRNEGTRADPESELVHRLILHKGMIQDVSFSCNGEYLASLGGPDDNAIVVWETESGEAVCGTPASSGRTLAIRWLRHNPLVLVSSGEYTLRKWELDMTRRRLFPSDVKLGTLKRVMDCIAIDDTDTFAWLGTNSGDVLEVNLNNERFTRASRERFAQGVHTLAFCPNLAGGPDYVLAGSGDGALIRLSTEALQIDTACQLMGAVTSISVSTDNETMLVGTTEGNLYVGDVSSFEPSLRTTAHNCPVNDIVFPKDCSELFLTCSGPTIRLWNTDTRAELLRIQVPNLECHCILVSPDGGTILSGWDDGKIRAFLPESGKLKYAIADAHQDCVTSIATTHDGQKLISGGKDGRVRVWDLSSTARRMELSFKEHKGRVTSIIVSRDDEECVTSGADGACIVWNLRRGKRQNALMASTVFQEVAYHPDESQLVTVGSDHKLGFWDAVDCSPIRLLEASTAELDAVAVAEDGSFLATGGDERVLRLWAYDEGVPYAIGEGHSGTINHVRIAPGGRKIVSVGSEGGIFVWAVPEMPEELHRILEEAMEGEA